MKDLIQMSAFALAIILATTVAFRIAERNTPEEVEVSRPQITILHIERVSTNYGNDYWYVDIEKDGLPYTFRLPSPQHVDLLLANLESRYTVDWLGVAK
jgi:hypothetical protein